MKEKPDIDLNTGLEALLAKGGRSTRRINIGKMHEVCHQQYESGPRNFSLPAIGRLAEAANVMKGRILSPLTTEQDSIFAVSNPEKKRYCEWRRPLSVTGAGLVFVPAAMAGIPLNFK